jgi:hypothetical protein
MDAPIIRASYYQFADGTRVEEMRDEKGWITRKIHLRSGVVRTAYDELKVVTSIQTDPTQYLSGLKNVRDPSSCVSPLPGIQIMLPLDTFLKEETVAGFRAFRLKDEQAHGIASVVTWRAPELACTEVQNSRTGPDYRQDMVCDRILLGDPDSTITSVDPSYAELPPSAARLRRLVAAGYSSQVIRRLMDRAVKNDKSYWLHRPVNPQAR